MIDLDADVAIIGSGFAGSLTALILNQIGLRPVLIEQSRHPRFAVGESSTPIADMVLRDLAQRFDLPRVLPLTSYGTWQDSYPQLVCGLKRGFSYFKHRPQQHFIPENDHANELLVAASADDQHSDTHWLRYDVDAFLVDEVCRSGIPYLDMTRIQQFQGDSPWQLAGQRQQENVRICARFLVDASGQAATVAQAQAIGQQTSRLQTCSRAIFSHFTNVPSWHSRLNQLGAAVEDHPFCCDHAAQHHILDGGWLWMLRFNDGRTSVGLVLDARKHPPHRSQSAQQEWSRCLDCYPSLCELMQPAVWASPPDTLLHTPRLQRMWKRMVGHNWAMLPHTAGFIDPLHSTGIAHTLCGIERLVQLLQAHWQNTDQLARQLQQYERALVAELLLIDQLVHGCYQAFARFDVMIAFSMLYFAAATCYEHRRYLRGNQAPGWFLCADDPSLQAVVATLSQQLSRYTRREASQDAGGFARQVAQAIAPFNHVGLCDPACHNMYRYTAAPR